MHARARVRVRVRVHERERERVRVSTPQHQRSVFTELRKLLLSSKLREEENAPHDCSDKPEASVWWLARGVPREGIMRQ
jgi:hypothetical protein